MSVDRDWAHEQLRATGYRATDIIYASVDQLLGRLAELPLATDEETFQAVEIFAKLATGQAIAPRDVMTPGGHWVQFKLGDYPPGTTVRVKDNAYTGTAGERHNGKVGRLVAARGGQAVVQYADSTEGTGQRHRPELLQVIELRT